jgi:hypothetical protein
LGARRVRAAVKRRPGSAHARHRPPPNAHTGEKAGGARLPFGQLEHRGLRELPRRQRRLHARARNMHLRARARMRASVRECVRGRIGAGRTGRRLRALPCKQPPKSMPFRHGVSVRAQSGGCAHGTCAACNIEWRHATSRVLRRCSRPVSLSRARGLQPRHSHGRASKRIQVPDQFASKVAPANDADVADRQLTGTNLLGSLRTLCVCMPGVRVYVLRDGTGAHPRAMLRSFSRWSSSRFASLSAAVSLGCPGHRMQCHSDPR